MSLETAPINAIERPSAPPLTRHESIVFLDTVGIGRMDAAELEQVFVMRKRCRPSRPNDQLVVGNSKALDDVEIVLGLP